MAHNWDSSKRRKDPPYWPILRSQVVARANGLCEHTDGCTYPGRDVDHIVNLAKGGTDTLQNLQLLCDWHHKRKTAQEATDARKAKGSITERRPTAQHPGFI